MIATSFTSEKSFGPAELVDVQRSSQVDRFLRVLNGLLGFYARLPCLMEANE